ncbi:hypothetical protein COCC4DRAFT_203754 [Bipolaris maydis ATCC 48331]|uniref:Uncharacterized protein n=2 Tax=Cochliobolus heterostrophus TaxID=5016 RepID=M2U832_COCH5|nr:uncharacterized protein COCC4DRAFT_203754 [Bipolaris maydis ATCC 48331]EMD94699.1 hypothetical protein COCHEDRAFT_1167779 [Bipolaris maydis C5]KAH7556093.1 hypothetical protein BM1_06619 [Bipolaris maydis]ENI01589.1 hypothetical protein COCC4DRAFT_203754 [Bipolaris maydis ATCC 48331]KAJ5029121.1 hypothetical protein J3E73DRAFT_421077 [Bipolaris maydis]KAJ5062149.1 hypothetical protein J3E74DRAFT_241999 [Bipolaris maydis]
MGAILSLPFTLLNLLLPFTRAGTPLSQDLLHTAILCGTLYFAPQIGEWYNARQQGAHHTPLDQTDTHDPPNQADNDPTNSDTQAAAADAPLDERLVLQDDDEADSPPGAARPRAPTPPPAPRHQAHVEDDEHHDVRDPFAPGPANPPPPPQPARAPPTHRTVGTKKAKSLARKDQQRAYNEWLRQEAEIRRRQEDEGREEREAALALERERRAAAEEVIRAKEREEREALKREREREAEEEAERRDRVVSHVKSRIEDVGCVDLVEAAWNEGKDRVWVERLLRASGLLGHLHTDGSRLLLTGRHWLVKIDQHIMDRAYAEAHRFAQEHGGKVRFEDLASILENVVLQGVERRESNWS